MGKGFKYDSVTIKGLPGKPENVGKSIGTRAEETAARHRATHRPRQHDVSGALIPEGRETGGQDDT